MLRGQRELQWLLSWMPWWVLYLIWFALLGASITGVLLQAGQFLLALPVAGMTLLIIVATVIARRRKSAGASAEAGPGGEPRRSMSLDDSVTSAAPRTDRIEPESDAPVANAAEPNAAEPIAPGSDVSASGAPMHSGAKGSGRGGVTRFLRSLRFVFVGVVISMFALGVVMQVTGISFPGTPTQQEREHAVQVMQEELQLLPPYPGSVEKGRLVVTAPGHGPIVDVNYSLSDPCVAPQAYYTNAAPAAGWTMTMAPRATGHLSEVDSTYRKTADGITMVMTIFCYADVAQDGSGYGLHMSL